MPSPALRFRRLLAPLCLLAGCLSLGLPWLGSQEKGAQDGPPVVATLKGHSELVYSVAFSPDGKYLVTGSFDNTLKLWEVATGKEIKTFAGPGGHKKMVLSVSFSPDGQMVASGGADNTLKVWDVPVSTPQRSVPGGETATAVSPDGSKVAGGGKDGSVRIFNQADGKELFKLAGHQGPITGLSFNANGQVLVSAGTDGTVRFWNAANGQAIAVVGAHAGPVQGVVFSPGNQGVYSVGTQGLLKFWPVNPPGTKKLPDHGGDVTALALSNDGNQVITGGADKVVRHSQANGNQVRVLPGANAQVASVAIAANNSLIAAGTADNRLLLWNAPDGKPLADVPAHGGPVRSLAFHPNNAQLATAGEDGLVKFWALPFAPARVMNHPDGVLAAAVSGNGQKFVTGGADKIVRLWNPANLQVERQFAGHAVPVGAVAITANANLLASAGSDAIRLWNPADGKEVGLLVGHVGDVGSLDFHPSGNQLVSAGSDGTVKVWQLPLVPARIMTHPDQLTCVALSADGQRILTGGNDKVARLWNLTNGNKERDFGGAGLPLTSVALSGNNALAAAGSADKNLYVWNLGDGKQLQKVALPAPVQAVAISPDVKIVAAGLADGSIRLIGAGDGKEVKALTGHKGAVTDLAYSPKGDVLYSAGADQAVQVWNTNDGAAKARYAHAGPITGLGLTKDGTKLAAVSGKTVKVWTTADGKEAGSFTLPVDARGIAAAPDGSRFALACADKLTRIVDGSGKLLEAFAQDGPVHAVQFVDPKKVVAVGADKTARLWSSALVWQQHHAGPVRQAVFSAKGDMVVSGGDDKLVKVFNAADGKEVRSQPAHDAAVLAVALSADGTKLATLGADKTARLWNLTTKPGSPEAAKPLQQFALPAPAKALALHAAGTRLAVGTTEDKLNPVRLYDAALGSELQVLTDHAGPVQALQFLADGRTLLSAGLDKTARLLDGNVTAVLPAHKAAVVAAQFHANGTQLLTAGKDKVVHLWDVAKGTPLRSFGPFPEDVPQAAFSKDYNQVAVAVGKNAKVFNAADGKQIADLVHPGPVLAVSFNQDKSRLITGSADKATRVWEIATGKELEFFPQEGPVANLAVTPQNAVVHAAGKTTLVDTPSLQRLIEAEKGPLFAVTTTPNGSHVLTAGTEKVVRLWNAGNGNKEREFVGAGGVLKTIAVSKNNQLVAAAGDDPAVRVWYFNDAKQQGEVKVPGAVKVLTFSPNSQVLAAVCADKSLRTWMVPFNPGQPPPEDFLAPVQTFQAEQPATDLAFAPDNATLWTASPEKNLQAWKMASPTPTRNFGHPNNVDAVAFQPNGTLVASGGHDGKIRLYDLVKGNVVKEINAHTNKDALQIYCLAFTPDGKRLVSGGYDNSLKLWDVPGGNMVREFKAYKVKEFEKGHQDGVFSVAFSPDGNLLASGSGGLERVIKIWNVNDGQVVRDLANPEVKVAPKQPPHSHPGWVYNLRWTKNGKLVSIGDAPLNKGYLAVWNPLDGKLLYSRSLAMGSFFGLDVSPDGSLVAIGAGPRGRPNPMFNSAYLLKMPQ